MVEAQTGGGPVDGGEAARKIGETYAKFNLIAVAGVTAGGPPPPPAGQKKFAGSSPRNLRVKRVRANR